MSTFPKESKICYVRKCNCLHCPNINQAKRELLAQFQDLYSNIKETETDGHIYPQVPLSVDNIAYIRMLLLNDHENFKK